MVEGLKGGNEALDALHQIMSLDDVEKIMGDTEDAIAYQNVGSRLEFYSTVFSNITNIINTCNRYLLGFCTVDSFV